VIGNCSQNSRRGRHTLPGQQGSRWSRAAARRKWRAVLKAEIPLFRIFPIVPPNRSDGFRPRHGEGRTAALAEQPRETLRRFTTISGGVNHGDENLAGKCPSRRGSPAIPGRFQRPAMAAFGCGVDVLWQPLRRTRGGDRLPGSFRVLHFTWGEAVPAGR
jgi:hypothetical protein